jgi:hypothetical protein
MTVLDQVHRFIERLSPEPVCDECIVAWLPLNAREHASQTTHELAGTAGFERRMDTCSLCGETKKVIGKARK